MEPNGSKYRVNNMGPKMEPWGTPQVMGADEENWLPNFAEKDLSRRQTAGKRYHRYRLGSQDG